MNPAIQPRQSRRSAAYSLPELLVCIAVMMVVYAGSILSYMVACRYATWSAYSLAAQGLTIRAMEQARSATWDVNKNYDQITNIPTYTTNILDLPYSGTNRAYATNYVTIGTITINAAAGIYVHMIRVDTTWSFKNKNYTNTIQTYRGPN